MRRGHGDSALGLGELEKLENDWASSVASGMGGSRHDKAGADALDEFEQFEQQWAGTSAQAARQALQRASRDRTVNEILSADETGEESSSVSSSLLYGRPSGGRWARNGAGAASRDPPPGLRPNPQPQGSAEYPQHLGVGRYEPQSPQHRPRRQQRQQQQSQAPSQRNRGVRAVFGAQGGRGGGGGADGGRGRGGRGGGGGGGADGGGRRGGRGGRGVRAVFAGKAMAADAARSNGGGSGDDERGRAPHAGKHARSQRKKGLAEFEWNACPPEGGCGFMEACCRCRCPCISDEPGAQTWLFVTVNMLLQGVAVLVALSLRLSDVGYHPDLHRPIDAGDQLGLALQGVGMTLLLAMLTSWYVGEVGHPLKFWRTCMASLVLSCGFGALLAARYVAIMTREPGLTVAAVIAAAVQRGARAPLVWCVLVALWLQAAYVSYYAYRHELWARWQQGMLLVHSGSKRKGPLSARRAAKRITALREHRHGPDEMDTDVAEQLHEEIEDAQEAERVDVGEILLLKHDTDGRGLHDGKQVAALFAELIDIKTGDGAKVAAVMREIEEGKKLRRFAPTAHWFLLAPVSCFGNLLYQWPAVVLHFAQVEEALLDLGMTHKSTTYFSTFLVFCLLIDAACVGWAVLTSGVVREKFFSGREGRSGGPMVVGNMLFHPVASRVYVGLALLMLVAALLPATWAAGVLQTGHLNLAMCQSMTTIPGETAAGDRNADGIDDIGATVVDGRTIVHAVVQGSGPAARHVSTTFPLREGAPTTGARICRSGGAMVDAGGKLLGDFTQLLFFQLVLLVYSVVHVAIWRWESRFPSVVRHLLAQHGKTAAGGAGDGDGDAPLRDDQFSPDRTGDAFGGNWSAKDYQALKVGDGAMPD